MVITSLQNEQVKKWMRLHQKKERDKARLFLVEEEHLLQEAHQAKCLQTLIVREDVEPLFEDVNVVYVTEAVMNKLSLNVSSVKMMGICTMPEHDAVDVSRIVMLDGVQDPGNVGTIIRTALSFGFEQVICSNDCADLFNEKTIRSSQGAIFHIPYVRGDLKDIIIQLKKEGFMVVGTDLSNSVPLKELKQQGKMVIVLGNEGQGMRKDVSSLCDINVKIEMKTFDSLNVAIAGGILMYTCAR